jgi:hypothetical protein
MMLIQTSTEEIVIDVLQRTGPCSLDVLVRSVPYLTWGEVFVAVDRMSRDGRVFIRQLSYSTYQIVLSSQIA